MNSIQPNLIVQSNFQLLLDPNRKDSEQIRTDISSFSELIKSPDHLHTYQISRLTLWNAAAEGMDAADVIQILNKHHPAMLPSSLVKKIYELMSKYGLFQFIRSEEGELVLITSEESALSKIVQEKSLNHCFVGEIQFFDKSYGINIKREYRGIVKREMIKLGYPVEDFAGFTTGESLQIKLVEKDQAGDLFSLRDYQKDAVDSFYEAGKHDVGSGVIVLPCGAGKTIVGMATMERLQCATLILTSNVTSVRQWKHELLQKTNLTEDMIGEYSGAKKEVRPVTIATYQILTYRKSKTDLFEHMKLFNERNWGLIIYDEVHLLPAPVFRATAEIQATRRLGLTATLIREDGREDDVFSLIGPKRKQVPWKLLEGEGWLASVTCTEVRVPLTGEERVKYIGASAQTKMRIASENRQKIEVIKKILQQHAEQQTLIIGQYLTQLHVISEQFHAPIITGEVSHAERESLYAKFKRGEIKVLVVSKVANFAVDLPDASVAIQVSGSFGSRQEEAQRMGRILRPKRGVNSAFFYTIVSDETREVYFAEQRRRFLMEQGYTYYVQRLNELEERDRELVQ